MITEKQQQIIDFDKGNILVSASAGSGKTFVMVERILRLILEGKANVDELLCVTFTVLAASEMKKKIADKIAEKMKETDGEESERLAKQLELLPMANISTVHAFCKNLIKEFFYEAGVDPSFSVVSDAERERLIKRAIDRYFDEMYDRGDEILNKLLPIFFTRRSDAKLKEKIVSVYKSIMTEADPFALLDRGEYYYTDEGIEEIYRELCIELREQITAFSLYAQSYAERLSSYPEMQKYLTDMVNALNVAAEGDSCDEINSKIAAIAIRKPQLKKADKSEGYLKARVMLDRLADDYAKFRKKHKERLLNDIEAEKLFAQTDKEVYRAFCKAVKGFAKAFEEEKRDENCVDFSDFEHLTLKILKNESIRNEVRSRFKYVFTDEYQDTSGVQEYILSAVSDDNLFMVGDVKQNIYDFRGCNPAIFADKRKKFETVGGGTVIDLDKNFRSTSAVISAVNRVFSGSMTNRCGRVDYAANPMIFGANYSPKDGVAEIRLVQKNSAQNDLPQGIYGVVKHLEKNENSGYFAEAAYIAELISQLYGREIDTGKGYKKQIEFGDIAILLRNANSVGDAYAKELIAAGIPVSANSKNSIGEYAEIVFLIDLLKLIGCFNLDIPLASVLKSPVGGLTDEELFSIRKYTPKGSFVDAYRTYLTDKTDDLSEKLRKFDEYMSRIRLISAYMPCDELLSLIIREKQIDVNLLASRMGEFKMNRVNAFIRAAGSKKQTTEEFLSGIEETVKELTISYDDDNAVKIMSVHASKGLEYPVVICAGGLKGYNDRDKTGIFIFDRNFGVAIAHYDTSKMIVTKTAYLTFLKQKLKRRSREEEMRILYVALTRARNLLYVVGEYDKKGGCPVFRPARYEGDAYTTVRPLDFFCENDMPIIDEGELSERKQYERGVRQVLIGEYDKELAELIRYNLDFKYASSESGLSVKRSVTSVAHFVEDDSPSYEEKPLFTDEDAPFFNEISYGEDEQNGHNINTTGEKEKVDYDLIGGKNKMADRRDIGTAYHAFLEKCDFDNDCESEINRLIDGHLLAEENILLLNRNKIKKILSMDIFKQIRGFKLYREQPFTAYIPAKTVDKRSNSEGEILIQGIIDLLCIKGDEAIVIDYKYTKERDEELLTKRYSKQLELYAYAVERVLKKKVIKTYLVNIYNDTVIDVL